MEAQGWMLVTLLSDRRTAVVKPGESARSVSSPMPARRFATLPSPASSAASIKCSDGWCRIAFGNRQGFIHTSDFWGVGEERVSVDSTWAKRGRRH